MQTSRHHYSQLIQLFNTCFAQQYNTRLEKGNDDPIYLPADTSVSWHRIIFAHGFYASALHEISHWCIAGATRRLTEDYGYWYCPDGRNRDVQQQFEQMETKPQALDWLFCVAADYPFHVSCDNLDGEFQPDRIAFQRKVHAQVKVYLQQGIPSRAACFIQALRHYYQTPPLAFEHFPWPSDLN